MLHDSKVKAGARRGSAIIMLAVAARVLIHFFLRAAVIRLSCASFVLVCSSPSQI